jgi:hypothetical protein
VEIEELPGRKVISHTKQSFHFEFYQLLSYDHVQKVKVFPLSAYFVGGHWSLTAPDSTPLNNSNRIHEGIAPSAVTAVPMHLS